jgi:transaldolase
MHDIAVPPASAVDAGLVRRLHGFVVDHEFGETPIGSRPSPLWEGLTQLGTQLWLDTGDLIGAEGAWCEEFSALTTNNSLLNAEVQKDVYDDVVRRAGQELEGLDPETRVLEVAFVLNAIHGLRLVDRFGGQVSVELHTALADDAERAVFYGQRLHALAPEHFLIKLPLTPAGLVATRRLRELGVGVNLTLGFSARQNYLATALARPDYVNVFLGRIGAYLSDNGLGDGSGAGEKATWASQLALRELASGRASSTRQIAASIRDAAQLPLLAGIDVLTIPLPVALAARELDGAWRDRSEDDTAVALAPGVDPLGLRLEQLWEVEGCERELAERLARRRTFTADEVVAEAQECGCGDLFPVLSDADRARLAADGKIPAHAAWEERIAAGEVAVDSLLNAAGLLAFSADQAKLDVRVRGLLDG